MAKLTIEDISRVLTEKNGLSREAAATFAREVFAVVQNAVERDKLVKVKGLGAFKVVDVEARESINVNTGARVLIEGHGKISFTPDTTMKELVNKPFSQFETVVLNEGVTFDDVATPDEDESNEEEEQQQPRQEEKAEARQEEKTEEKTETRQEAEEQPIPQEIEKSSNRAIEQSTIREIEQSKYQAAEDTAPEAPSEDVAPEEPSKEDDDEEDIAPEEPSKKDDDEEDNAPENPSEDADEKEDEEEDTDDDEESNVNTAKWIVAAVISLVLIVLAACGGYIYGLNKGRAEARELAEATEEPKPQAPQSKDSLLAALHPEEPVVLDTTSKQPAKDTAKAEQKGVPTKSPKAEQKAKAEQKTKPEAKPTPKPEPSSKYEQMDARVRTGAYRIVGVDRTITVKKGETLKRISKTYLGEGMECYVEVLNGLSGTAELKEGSKVKIPKLELKKKSK